MTKKANSVKLAIDEKASPVFVHSLFRSGSTYFYNALKRVGKCHVYHEPFHEAIGELPTAWNDLISRSAELKGVLRHDFLKGSYFDEYAHLLPYIKQTFQQCVSYELFFLDRQFESQLLKAYVDCLIQGANSRPVFQCTRTIGRIDWLKENYPSSHIFLLRNPWDQWYSYKVDRYIASTPQVIYSQPRLAPVLAEISEACGFSTLPGKELHQQVEYAWTHPQGAEVDYFLFFGLWCYAYLTALSGCDLVLDMDAITRLKGERNAAEGRLKDLGLAVSLNDCELHRALFRPDELEFFRHVENQVIEIFKRNGFAVGHVLAYLKSERTNSFSIQRIDAKRRSMALADGPRMRGALLQTQSNFAQTTGSLNRVLIEHETRALSLNQELTGRESELLKLTDETVQRGKWALGLEQELNTAKALISERDQQLAVFAQTLAEREGQLSSLLPTLAERDQQITSLGRAASERDQQVAILGQALAERDHQLAGLIPTLAERDQQITSLGQAVSERDQQVAILGQALAERDHQLAGLIPTLAERDQQITNLGQAVSERDQQVAILSRALAERDHQLAGLLPTLAERDQQIASLGQAVSDRDQQVTVLGQALAEHDTKLASLLPILAERDQQIASLGLAVTERDQQVAILGEALAERDNQLASLKQSFAESDQLSAKLARSVSEREDQLASLLPILAERDLQVSRLGREVSEHENQLAGIRQIFEERVQQIADLRQALSERDRQLATLHDVVSERDRQLATLHDVVSERDSQFASLENGLVERESKIAALKQLVVERAAQINSLNQALANQVGRYNQKNSASDQQLVLLGQTVAECRQESASLNQALADQAKQFSRTIEERDHSLASLRQLLAERERQVSQLTDETVRRGEWALGLDEQLRASQAEIARLISTNSWKITRPFREMRRWLTNPAGQSRRYVRFTAEIGKVVYRKLPLHQQTKAKHRLFVAKHAPSVLLATNDPHRSAPPTSVAAIQPLNQPLAAPEQASTECSPAAGVVMSTSTQPLVSVIIPIYGHCDHTLRCLASIAANPPAALIEVIVVNDCSPDNSVELLQAIDGIRLLSNATNMGFIRSCNRGASEAKGQFLFFLNNDTEVTPGWLDELVRTFELFPGTGYAGSKLIYPDGRLQEAGGIIWQNGSGWNFGRLQDPSLPVYNYAREVDYCSGAAIMVPKALFDELGGFDEHYVPAYCEDADLALKIRDKGYRVIYQPMSVVIHYEGVTSGTDLTQGVKAYQVVNSKKLYARWQTRLLGHQLPGLEVDKAKDRRATRRVLYLDHCTPTPDQDSGSIDAYNHMLLLREMDFQVTFVPEDNFLYMSPYTADLQRIGIEVLYAPHHVTVEQHLKECGDRYDLAFLSRPVVGERYVNMIRALCPRAKILFHTVDLHFLRMQRAAELSESKEEIAQAEEMKRREIEVMQASDITTVISEHELQLLTPYFPDRKVRLLPYSRNVRGTGKTFADRRDIVFVGGYQHAPNIDAVQYFVREIMPLLRKQLPGVRFFAVGSKVPPEIRALETEDVIITGFVEELNPLLDKMRVSVAPLRYGAGIKGKIGTAMTVGLPVVATSLAAEGMSLSDGENILVADGAEAFANTIARIYQDEATWNRISQNGLAFADKAWGAEASWKILADILAELKIGGLSRRYPISLYSEFKSTPNNAISGLALKPIASAKNRGEFEAILNSESLKQIKALERQLLGSGQIESFTVEGFCVPCDKKVAFLVDMNFGGQRHENEWIPNWRERLECPLCGMNNRQRLVATLIKQALSAKSGQKVYFMEQVTPIFNWASATLKEHRIVGSEYLGHEYEGGSTVNGIRHEDVENLSFPDAHLDLIVSNDVLEHVPHPARAFAECARVLRSGGVMLATIPFKHEHDISVTRSRITEGTLEHMLPPAYHGNPVSAEGSLVFTDFGWDLLDLMRQAGFSEVNVDVYASAELCHLGGGQLVFSLAK